MRSTVTLAVIVLASLMTIPAAAQSADEGAIRKLSQEFSTAVSKGDAKAAAALFTADGDYLSSTGRWARGAAEIEKLVADQAAGAFKGLTFKTAITDVRMIKPDVALASGTFESATRKGLSSFVAVRDAGRWKIAAVRAMIPAK